MLTQIDRQLFRSFLKSYAICLVSLLSLFVVVDLFNNIDDFARVKGGVGVTLKHLGLYYAVQITHIFDRLSEAIVLLAAMFTIAWLQRNNELLPLLSAGVSTRRVLRPVLLGACLLLLVNVANQELLIPRVGNIPIMRDDPDLEKTLEITGGYDGEDIQITRGKAVRKDKKVYEMLCLIPASMADGRTIPLDAKEAQYIPPNPQEKYSGGWYLTQVDPPELDHWSRTDILQPLDRGKYFLFTDLDFERLTRERNWFTKASTLEIFSELDKVDANKLAGMAVFFHMRLTRPWLGMILVVMGLSTILRDQNRNVFLSAGFCLVIGALFYAVCLAGKYLGDREILSPPLAAWLPVFIFGPVAFVLHDAVHT